MLEWLQPLSAAGGHEPLAPGEWWTLAGICVGLLMFSGTSSGLTLGLMSLDAVDMEVLKRSGTAEEKRYAARIIPVIANEHFLLVTLLLCNAAANEALPLFLDRLADPLTAVLLSVSVVLLFGEVLPQAVCSRYGLQIGASSAWFVRVLMALTSPLSWPIGKLLDWALGGEHTALFRRAQLKALVGLHAEDAGMGGTLSVDEISIITGALDLTHKTAWTAMTPLDKVFMLPVERPVDEECLQDILSRGHSRVPVYTAGDRHSIVGLLLVKELVLVDPAEGLAVGQLPIRPLPRLSAATPLYDMLKLFETGGSHMALLTRPAASASGSGSASAPRPVLSGAGSSSMQRARSGLIVAGDTAYMIEAAGSGTGARAGGEEAWAPPGGWGDVAEGAAVGVITLEDTIEELLGAEIIDETDLYVDNQQTSRVDAGELSKSLPARLRKVLARGVFTPRVGRLGVQRPGWSAGADTEGAATSPPPASPGAAGALPGDGEWPHVPPGHAVYRVLPQGHGAAPQQTEAAAGWQHMQQQDWGAPAAAAAAFEAGPSGSDAAAALPGIERMPSNPVMIRGGGGGISGSREGSAPSGTPSSWLAGAHTGARRVRFAGDSLHGTIVLKPRLQDPDEGEEP